jgi:hypothetical protein
VQDQEAGRGIRGWYIIQHHTAHSAGTGWYATGEAGLRYVYRPVLLEGCISDRVASEQCFDLGTGESLQLPGFGVEMAVKNMEYSALDDKVTRVVLISLPPHHHPMEPGDGHINIGCRFFNYLSDVGCLLFRQWNRGSYMETWPILGNGTEGLEWRPGRF